MRLIFQSNNNMEMKNLSRICMLIAVVMFGVADVYALTGSWRGNLNLGQMKVPLVFNFSETAAGEIDRKSTRLNSSH